MKTLLLSLLLTVSAFAEPVVKDTDIQALRANLVKQRDLMYLQGSQFNSIAMTKCGEQLDETIKRLDALPRVDMPVAKPASKDTREVKRTVPVVPVILLLFL